MRGHNFITTMREEGLRPGCVYLETSNYPPEWLFWPEWKMGDAKVHIEADDRIEQADLTFLYRCNVVVNGYDVTRVREVFSAAQDHGASRVIGNVSTPLGELVEIIDTDAIMTWRKTND